MGLALHANWYDGQLFLWGAHGTAAPVTDDPFTHVPGLDPASLSELRAALGELTADALLASVAVETSLLIRLPATPAPPSPQAPPGDDSPAAVAPIIWQQVSVPALALTAPQAIDLLASLPDPLPAGGSDSLQYWALLARLNLELIGNRQFVPHMDDTDGEFQASWRPVVQDRDQLEWLEQFADAMPPICRAVIPLVDDDEPAQSNEPDLIDPAHLVETFLASTADAVIRRAVADDEFFHQPQQVSRDALAPPETRWLAGLLGASSRVKGDFSENITLCQMVQSWVGQLEPSAAASSMRLNFRLEEPVEPETDEQADTIQGDGIETGDETADEIALVEKSLEQPVESDPSTAEADHTAGASNGSETRVTTPMMSSQPSAPWRLSLSLQSPDESEPPVSAEELWINGSGSVLLGRNLKNRQARLLAELARAHEIFPGLSLLRDESTPTQMLLPTADAYAFIRRWAPALREQGFGVVLPEWADRTDSELGLRLMVRPLEDSPLDWLGSDEDAANAAARPPRRWGEPIELSSGHFGLDSLLDFDWQIAVGDLRLSPAEFRQLAEQNTPLVKLRGQWVQVDLDAARKAVQFIDSQGGKKLTLADALRTAYGANKTDTGLPILGLGGSSWIEQLLEQAPGIKVESYTQPPEFEGTLRPYQLKGLHWMAFLDPHRYRCLPCRRHGPGQNHSAHRPSAA